MKKYPCHEYSKEIDKLLNFSENVYHPRLEIKDDILALGSLDSTNINDLKAYTKFEIRLNADALEKEAFLRTDLFFT